MSSSNYYEVISAYFREGVALYHFTYLFASLTCLNSIENSSSSSPKNLIDHFWFTTSGVILYSYISSTELIHISSSSETGVSTDKA